MGIFALTQIGRGHFSEVYSCRGADGHPTGRALKVSKTASSLDSIKEGQAGTEAWALLLGEMSALAGGLSPFVRVMPQMILLAVPVERDQYASVLLMEEGLRTATDDVAKLARGVHFPNGSFSPPGLKAAGQFFKEVLGPLSILHSLDIAHRDLKPANMLRDKDNFLVLSDAGMAVFPTLLHMPVPSPGASPPTPSMRPPIASARARSLLLSSAGPTAVSRSPPANQATRVTIHINPTELQTIFSRQFRNRDNAGTHVFAGPEFPFARRKGAMTSKDFLPGDMWAVGWIFLQILSGYNIRWMESSEEKSMLANSSPQDFWVKHLHRTGTPSMDPAVLCAIDLVRGLLKARPEERLTCSAALAHPFLLSRA